MSIIIALVDQAVGEALASHPEFLTQKGQEAARKLIVRKVTKALRESLSVTKPDADGETTPAAPETPQPQGPIKSWSREWWAALLRRIERHQPTELMLRCALSGSDWAAEREPVPVELVERMTAYPSDGDIAAAWRPWFLKHRVNLPEWRQQVWIFLPSETPPDTASTGPPAAA